MSSLSLSQAEPEEEQKSYEGSTGTPLKATANWIRLKIDKDKTVYEYHVAFNPQVCRTQV